MFRINRTIQLLMVSDIFVLTGFGLIDPILAIYIKDGLVGGTVFSAAFASTLFLLVKSLVQLPFSRSVDKMTDVSRGRWLLLGTVFIAVVPFIYIFSSSISYIYLAQILHGAGSGLAYSAWLGIWSTHLDKGRESYEWSLYSTMVGIGTAVSAFIGGFVAQYIGFRLTFALVGVFALAGCGFLFVLLRQKKNLARIQS
ncbi:MAG: MFS transporter [bacterium]|nr:MFS transporter [bacterium]